MDSNTNKSDVNQKLSNNTIIQTKPLQVSIEDKDSIILSLKSRITQEYLPAIEKYKEKIKELEKQNASYSVIKEEHEVIIVNLRKEVKLLSGNLEVATMKCKSNEQSVNEEMINKLQLQLSEKNALITRLRTENQTIERNYALKNTLLSSYDIKLNEMKQEIQSTKSNYEESINNLSILETTIKDLEVKLNEKQLELINIQNSNQKLIDELKLKYETINNNLINSHLTEVEDMNKEYLKRSNFAKAVICEKEEDLRLSHARIKVFHNLFED